MLLLLLFLPIYTCLLDLTLNTAYSITPGFLVSEEGKDITNWTFSVKSRNINCDKSEIYDCNNHIIYVWLYCCLVLDVG